MIASERLKQEFKCLLNSDFNYLSSKTTGSNIQTYDFNETTGNLETRTYNGLSESFTYDNMDRLKTYYGGAVNYDLNGNITTKTGTGTYQYDDTKKNAVTGITNNPGTINLSQEITYTLFNKTATVSQETDLLTFTYGPDESRIKSVLTDGGITTRTTYYSPGYERITDASGTRELNYVSGPFGLVAILVKEGNNITTLFTETDHLGSITGLLTDDGHNIERHSFDAWGRRRNPYNWSYDDIPQSNITDRGFTGHEHLDRFGLINMNGRMYDPILGRFCGVDPFIQFPDNSQSFNGYSYCVNNPLRYIDPSGYNYKITLKALWQKIKSLFVKNDDKDESSESIPELEWDEATGLPWLPVLGGNGIGATSDKSGSSSTDYLIPFRCQEYQSILYKVVVSRRFEECGTVSDFRAKGPIPLKRVNGFMLEPEGPSTVLGEMNLRIPSGVYWLTPYSGTKNKNVYRISNASVRPDRYILIHTGTLRINTAGCFLVGEGFSVADHTIILSGSQNKLNDLRALLGKNTAILILHDIY